MCNQPSASIARAACLRFLVVARHDEVTPGAEFPYLLQGAGTHRLAPTSFTSVFGIA